MKYTTAPSKKSTDDQVAMFEQQIEIVKNQMPVWEAEVYDGEEPTEIDTSQGKMTVMPGDYIMSGDLSTVVVTAEHAEDTDRWVPVEDES